MRLIVARHGNTFWTGQEPVFIDASCDLPLTDEGRQQALRLADALCSYPPDRIIAAPLLRTWEYAWIIARSLQDRLKWAGTVQEDRVLSEIDYGSWTQKSMHAIDPEAYRAWQEQGVLHGRGLDDRMRPWLDSLSGSVLIVTSAGIARFLGHVIESGQWKMATGKVSVCERCDGEWHVLARNVAFLGF